MRYTIGIITKNNRKELLNCIQSIYRYIKNIPVVIVEAGDNVGKLSYEKLKHIIIPENEAGFSHQRNIVVDNVETEYVIFIDDDVEIREGWFEDFTSEFEKYPDKLGAMGAVFPKQNNIISFITGVMGHPGGGFRFHKYSKGENVGISQIATCNTILNIKAVKSVGGFNVRNVYGSEDSDLSIRITEKYGKNKFLYIPRGWLWHYSPDNLYYFLKWYLRRGKADFDLYLTSKKHLRYLIRTSIMLKFLFMFIVGLLTSMKVFLVLVFLWYFLQLLKYSFMFKYFKNYRFNFFEKIFIFLFFPVLKFVADFMFDIGRITRIIELIL